MLMIVHQTVFCRRLFEKLIFFYFYLDAHIVHYSMVIYIIIRFQYLYHLYCQLRLFDSSLTLFVRCVFYNQALRLLAVYHTDTYPPNPLAYYFLNLRVSTLILWTFRSQTDIYIYTACNRLMETLYNFSNIKYI